MLYHSGQRRITERTFFRILSREEKGTVYTDLPFTSGTLIIFWRVIEFGVTHLVGDHKKGRHSFGVAFALAHVAEDKGPNKDDEDFVSQVLRCVGLGLGVVDGS